MNILEFFQRVVAFFLLGAVCKFIIAAFILSLSGWLGFALGLLYMFTSYGLLKIARFPFVNRFNTGFWVW